MYSMLTIFGNIVLMGFFIIVAASIQANSLNYSSDVRIRRDAFVPVIASTSILFFTSVMSMLILFLRDAINVSIDTKLASHCSAAFKFITLSITFAAFAIPFMTPKVQTRFVFCAIKYLLPISPLMETYLGILTGYKCWSLTILFEAFFLFCSCPDV